MPILSTDKLSKTYTMGETQVQALQDANIAFEAGEFCAITGPSGSGKSTLLHALGGLEYPTFGRVIYQGKDLFKLKDDQLSILRRRRFGFIFQAYNLVQELTGMENILLPIMLDNQVADQAYLDRVIDMLGIRDRLSHLPSAMSGGEQQRIAIARALANKPAILFADEPTGNLDGQSGREVLALLRYAGSEFNATLILVTHDLNIAEQAERIVSLKDGRIVHDTRRPVDER